MIKLKKNFTKSDFKHSQLARDGNIALYERSSVRYKGGIHFEVIKIRKIPEVEIKGRVIAEHEQYPSAENFGTYGWTFQSLQIATQKYKELVECNEG